jgi:thioredoxin reductase
MQSFKPAVEQQDGSNRPKPQHEFRKRYVPNLEHANITAIQRSEGGFQLETGLGETLQARRVVVAVGITHFSYQPPFLSNLPAQYISHSLQHGDLRASREEGSCHQRWSFGDRYRGDS